ncbi:MAG: Holliday junction branch migration protein RuvA [Leptonema sp. (in: Bacteria)]|nr:Holliday junction branch migration protein RuvA [Leptonema sp. (in: bacteria)]
MISGLLGHVQRFGASKIYFLVGAVEYEVNVPLDVFEYLQHQKENQHFLYIYHLFTGEDQRLFGFLHPSQRELFGAILSLKGFGSVLALSVLSHVDLPKLLDLCERSDVAALAKIPRVGKKTAESLIFEVNQKKQKFKKLLQTEPTHSPTDISYTSESELAIQALIQLGYKEAQIQKVFSKVLPEVGDVSASELIRQTLKHL